MYFRGALQPQATHGGSAETPTTVNNETLPNHVKMLLSRKAAYLP